jgi:hypothetical protein
MERDWISTRLELNCDWSAGIPACNVAASAASNDYDSGGVVVFSCFALMQAGMPALQSHRMLLTCDRRKQPKTR